MSRVRTYFYRGTVTSILSFSNVVVMPDGDSASVTSTGVVVHAQYTSPSVGDRVQVLVLGRQHYAQGKIA